MAEFCRATDPRVGEIVLLISPVCGLSRAPASVVALENLTANEIDQSCSLVQH
jgi:hypothetical protein